LRDEEEQKMEKGKTYFYEVRGCVVSGMYIRSTPAWDIFKREDGTEDWIHSYSPAYDSIEQYKMVRGIVDAMAKATHVPDVILAPVGSPRDGR
jgi:hypothetical protein